MALRAWISALSRGQVAAAKAVAGSSQSAHLEGLGWEHSKPMWDAICQLLQGETWGLVEAVGVKASEFRLLQ